MTSRQPSRVLGLRTAWAVAVVPTTILVTVGFVYAWNDPVPVAGAVMDAIGDSVPRLRAAMIPGLIVPFFASLTCAVVIFVKRPRDPAALLFSAALVLLFGYMSRGPLAVSLRHPWTEPFVIAVGFLAFTTVVGVLIVFPDGQPWPRWSLLALLPVAAVGLLSPGVFPAISRLPQVPRDIGVLPWEAVPGLISISVATGLAAQVVRFRSRSTPAERQQAKWAVYPILALAVWAVIAIAVSSLTPASSAYAWLMVIGIPLGLAIPVSVTIAVLKYRLYDIDVVISRTLVFMSLTIFITGVYVGIVVGIGRVLGGGDEPNVALSLLATGIVAVAFQPVRRRVQHVANRVVFGRRATPYEVLADFSRRAHAKFDDLTRQVADSLADGTGASGACVWVATGERLVPAAVVDATPRALSTPEAAHELNIPEAAAAVPVVDAGELIGALSLHAAPGEQVSGQDRALLDHVAAGLGLSLRNARLTTELRRRVEELESSRQRLVTVQDTTRQKLERDLRAGAYAELTEVREQLAAVHDLARTHAAEQTAAMLEQLCEDTGDALESLDRFAAGVFPPVLEAHGLEAALREAARNVSVPVTLHAIGLSRYERDVAAAVYFCVLEALQNVMKYAAASAAQVSLREEDDALVFAVTDDGVGFDPATVTKGAGTTNMADRLDAVGGSLSIQSAPGSGTTISARLSIRERTRPERVVA